MTAGEAIAGFWVTVIGSVLGCSFIALMMLVNAFVLIRLWAWFIPAIFPSAPLLTYPTAMGITLIAGVLKGRVTTKEDKNWKEIGLAFLLPFLSLGIGFIVKSFI